VIGHGQEVSGSISGTIEDPTGASVKGANITLTNIDRGQDVRTLTTNGAGFYTATSLPLGTYTIKIVAAGFQSSSVTSLVLHVDDKLTVNQQLKVGSSDQNVTVTADALRVNLEDAAAAGLINGTQVRELVLSTRNYEQLLSLQPGVAYTGATDQIYLGPTNPLGGANTVAFSVGGQRTSANNWTIDGADNVDRGSNLTLLAFPSVDAIAEFKTLRGTYSAEYGRSAAGQVNVVTRSGTNQLHGSAYEFFRNDILQANNYFNNLTAAKRPPLRYNDYGYTIGGPVVIPKVYDGRGKTFFFWSQEFRRVITYSPVALYVPTAAERTGSFPVAICGSVSSGGTCNNAGTTQLTAISATAQAYLKDIYASAPLPNPAAGQDLHQYTYSGRNVFNDTQEFVRIDHAFGQKVNVFYRYLHDSIPTQEPFGYGSGSTGLPGVQNTQTKSPGTQQLGHVTYVINSKLLIDGGFFGRILSVKGEFGYWVFEGDWQTAQRPSWNYRKSEGGGIILDMLCHWRYVLDGLFGKVESVSCLGANFIKQRWDESGKPYAADCDDAAFATFQLQGGITHDSRIIDGVPPPDWICSWLRVGVSTNARASSRAFNEDVSSWRVKIRKSNCIRKT